MANNSDATRLLFMGDIVGEPGLRYLEVHLPRLRAAHDAHFLVVNAENMRHVDGEPGAGMTDAMLNRLFALDVDLVTGGNHSWDGPEARSVHGDERVLRPLNVGEHAPGRGTAVIEKRIDGRAVRLGVINVASRTALAGVDQPLAAVEAQLAAWSRGDTVDFVLVDFHGESVYEKIASAFALDGRVAALVGTHTHVPTFDARVLPQGTAYVSDVGMTGPSGGMQGYDATFFVEALRTRLPPVENQVALAQGPVELGAVLIAMRDGRAQSIERLGRSE